jgi:sugar phosphate permease
VNEIYAGGKEMALFYGKQYYKWILLIVCIFIYSSGNVVRWNYTGISSYLMSEWQIGKPELGIMGAAFFYAYAIGQSPWGSLTDIFGGRKVIPAGVGITTALFALFAFVQNYHQALVIRALMGFVGAASFVPCMAVLAKWFGKKERGMAMNLFSGTGGGIGEASSFLLMPLMALFMTKSVTLFGLTTWRASTLVMALVVLVITLIAIVGLRSDPTEMGLESVQASEDTAKAKKTNYKEVVLIAFRDPAFWVIALVWQGFTVCLRLVPAWLPLYAAAYYTQHTGMDKAQAMVAGGAMATVYVLGRIIGTPVVGKYSDYLKGKGVPRTVILLVVHVLILVCLYLFTTPISSAWIVGVLSFVCGVLINLFPLINATAAEIWSIKTCGLLMGFINTIGQLLGATALSYSGFMAVKFSVQGGGFNVEYQGIWYLAMIFTAVSVLASIYAVYREKKAIAEN